jgi:hypothetical protein
MGRAAALSGSNPGAVYNYNVRSNSDWTISSVVEHPRTTASGMTPLIAAHTGSDNVYTGAAGLSNTTPGGGYREQLTTNPNARGNSGYADVTYTSNPTGRFANVTQRLFFPSAPFVVYGIVKFSDPNVNFYNIFAGATNKTPGTSTRSQHIHPMLNATNNYGINLSGSGNTATPSSTVFVPAITVNGVNYNDGSQLTVTDINDAVTAGADMLFISGSTTFGDDTAKAIFDNFLAKDKPVLLAVEDANTMSALWTYVGSGRLVWTSQALNGNAPVYQYKDVVNDPIIYGAFGWLRNLYWGCDGTGSIAYAPDDMSQLVSYSNAQNRSGATDSAVGNENNGWTTCFRLNRYPLVFAADGGLAGCFDTSDTRAPALINTSGNTPTYKANYGGGSTKQSVYNSYFIANTIAWAIQRRTTHETQARKGE